MAFSLRDLFGKLGIFIHDNRWAVFFIFILMIFVSILGASLITMSTGMDTYVSKDSKMYQDLDLYKDSFSTESIVVMIEGRDVHDPAVLKAMERTEDLTKNIPGVSSTVSPATLVKAVNNAVNGRSEIPGTAEEVEYLMSLSPDTFSNLIFDDTHCLLLVSYGNITEEQKKDILKATQDAVEFAGYPAGYSVIVTGSAALTNDMQVKMGTNMSTLLALAVVLMIVALFFVFKGVRWKLFPLAVVLLGIIYSFGFMGFIHLRMTMVSMAAFPILIGLGIDYAIQFHNRMEEELRRSESYKQAVCATVGNLGPAVMSALIVTCVSFISLLTSAVPMIRDFGYLLIIGCILCYISGLFFGVVSIMFLDKLSVRIKKQKIKTGRSLFPLSFLFPERMAAPQKETDTSAKKKDNIIVRILGALVDLTLRYKLLIIIMALATGLTGWYVDSTIPAETDSNTYIPQDMASLIHFRHMNTVMGGDGAFNLIITTDDIASPEVLKWMDDFASYEVSNQVYVISSESIVDVVKRYNNGTIPDTREEILAIYETIPPETMAGYSRGNTMLLLNLNVGTAFNDLPMEGVKSLLLIIEDDLEWRSPPAGTSVTVTGSSVPLTELLGSLLSGRTQQTVIGLILVLVSLYLIYRDILKALAPLIPMIVVIGWSGIVMYAFDIVYTPMTAVLGCMILGVGSEYSILLMERFYEEKPKSASSAEAIRTAVTSTGIALVVSGTTTIFGFLALVASDFPIIGSFGTVTVINMLTTLAASFIIFPSLIVSLDRLRGLSLKNIFSASRGKKEKGDVTHEI
ncbi:RND family transporter [Methanosarcinaceae archaeon]|nr:RND family transporter [Methanosarcinaceae archaeon]